MYINYFFINFLYKTKENQSSSRNRFQFFWQVNIQKALFFVLQVHVYMICQLLMTLPISSIFALLLSSWTALSLSSDSFICSLSALIISSFSPPNLLDIYDVNFSLNTLASLLCLNLSNSMFHHEVFDIS